MSTRCSMYYPTTKTKYLHVFTDCFDETKTVYLELWQQGRSKNSMETLAVPRVLWKKLEAEIRKGKT